MILRFKEVVDCVVCVVNMFVNYLFFSMNILRFRNDGLTPAITGAASVAHFL